MPVKNIDDVHRFLDAIPTFKATGKRAADFSLDRFRTFCSALGDPHEQFPSIHVAGSNGKGSTCHILASIYIAADYKTGVYTSPHITSYNERFTMNGNTIPDDDLVEFFQRHMPRIKSFRLTYFEISTAIAFWWFARQQIEVAIIETGVGGRLDTTNIITPLACIITTVSLDHTDILGDTIEAIAMEKAGIIKPDIPVIIGNMPVSARKIINQKAHAERAGVLDIQALNPRWEDGNYLLEIEGRQMQLQSTLKTPVQAYNIAVAWQVVSALNVQLPVTDEQRKEGIREAGRFANTARFERLHPEFKWYFDGGHNQQAVQAMKQMVSHIKPVNETILVLSIMNDKINKKMALEFLEFKKIIYHTLSLGRAATMEDIQHWLPHAQPFPAQPNARNSLFKEFESELVIFAGSFYFYPTVRDWVSKFNNTV